MEAGTRERLLRIALVAIGLIFVVGLAALTMVWPSAWMWEPRQSEYEQMILGVYVTLGIFLLIAARDPRRHRSLIWFTVWSSAVHMDQKATCKTCKGFKIIDRSKYRPSRRPDPIPPKLVIEVIRSR